MEFVQKELSGSIFRNQKKLTENHPNMTGRAMIEGIEYLVSAWTKTDKNGNKWQSLSFIKKDQFKTRALNVDDDENVPF